METALALDKLGIY